MRPGDARTIYDVVADNKDDLVGVADVFAGLSREEGAANARLIAAAPDLLTVLAEYIDFNGEYAASMPDDAWVERARSAVAKATGGGS